MSKEHRIAFRKTAARLLHYGDHLWSCAWYVMARPALSETRFIIFGRGRSGSTALVSLLQAVPGIHCDGEVLNRPVSFPRRHVLAQCARARAGVYGCKILSYQIRSVQPITQRTQFIRHLHAEGFKIIYLKRGNLLKHALSNIRARAYGFHQTRQERRSARALTVAPEAVLTWMKQSEALDAYEQVLLHGVDHLSLTYERHLEEEGRHQATVDLICAFLGVAPAAVQSAFRKVSPRSLRASLANYEEVAGYLANTPYSRYLDAEDLGQLYQNHVA